VRDLVRELDEHALDWGHPNRFEAMGVQMLRGLQGLPLLAAPPYGSSHVVTVNRVQDVAPNFVYGDNQQGSAEVLLQYWHAGYVLDIEAYAHRRFAAVHIGEMYLCDRHDRHRPAPQFVGPRFSAVMILDYVHRLRATGSALVQHPRLSDFVLNFDAYFRMPGAWQHGPVRLAPVWAGEQEPFALEDAAAAQRWIRQRLGEDTDERCLDIGRIAIAPGARRLQPRHWLIEAIAGIAVPASEPCDTLVCCSGIELAGLGSFGEGLHPDGVALACARLLCWLQPGARLLGAVPIAREPSLFFDSGRILTRQMLLERFAQCALLAEACFFPEQQPWTAVATLPDGQAAWWCFELRS